MTLWEAVEPELWRNLQRILDNDPVSLLERDGGPSFMKADVVLARLIGWDDETVGQWRIPTALPFLYKPIRRALTFACGAPLDPETAIADLHTSTATFNLQSNYVTDSVDSIYAPPDVKCGPPTFQFTVLYVRYKRAPLAAGG